MHFVLLQSAWCHMCMHNYNLQETIILYFLYVIVPYSFAKEHPSIALHIFQLDFSVHSVSLLGWTLQVQLFTHIIHRYRCSSCLILYFLPLAVSCGTTDVAVTCHYRYIRDKVPPPMWELDGQKISPTSKTECNDTVSKMVYDFSGLCPGEYVFHGISRAGPHEVCCGPAPEVSINLTLTASKISMHLHWM